MDVQKAKKVHIIYVIMFLVLNILNTYFATTQILNRYISPVERTVIGEMNAIFGNLAILLLMLAVIYKVFKKDKNRMRSLMYITLFLNTFIYLINIYNMFYSTTFTVHSLDIFKNPSEGVAHGLLGESLLQLIVYFRILIFIPFVTLLVLLFLYKKYTKGFEFKTDISLKRIITATLSSVVLLTIASLIYVIQITNHDFHINAISSTRGVQNYGVYPYYVTELLGVNFNYTTKKRLEIETLDELYEEYNYYNKNKDSYYNFIDGKTYSNELLLKDSILNDYELLNLNENDSLTGIFKDKNLVLVHLESLNYFLFDIPEVRERFTFLNKLFEESIVFENYYTSVGMGVSSDAEVSVLTGLYPNGYSTFYRDYQEGHLDMDTIPKLFNEQGYKTKAYHGDHPKFYNRDIAYKELIEFSEEYYSIDDFARRDGFTSSSEYLKERMKGYDYNGLEINSTWPSEFEMFDIVEEDKEMFNSKYMVYPMFLTMHTPFLFNPYIDQEYDIENYQQLKSITKRYLEYAKYIDELIESSLFNPVTKESRIDSNSVYVFYSDHGSGIKNGDLNLLYEREISILEERKMLQHSIAFIYAPSDEVDSSTNINKGLLTGTQKLARGHVDLYRTIGELFGLFDNDDFYFGVHGLSNEPTFVIDNRIQDVAIDNIDNIEETFFLSLRNLNKKFPNIEINNQVYVINKIKQFKKLSDLLLIDDTVYADFKKAINLRNNVNS